MGRSTLRTARRRRHLHEHLRRHRLPGRHCRIRRAGRPTPAAWPQRNTEGAVTKVGIAGLDWQNVSFNFAAGLQTKGEKRNQSPPYLDTARDVEYDDIGGVRTRKPFNAMGNSILGGGT